MSAIGPMTSFNHIMMYYKEIVQYSRSPSYITVISRVKQAWGTLSLVWWIKHSRMLEKIFITDISDYSGYFKLRLTITLIMHYGHKLLLTPKYLYGSSELLINVSKYVAIDISRHLACRNYTLSYTCAVRDGRYSWKKLTQISPGCFIKYSLHQRFSTFTYKPCCQKKKKERKYSPIIMKLSISFTKSVFHKYVHFSVIMIINTSF